jgi:hypothetical protein
MGRFPPTANTIAYFVKSSVKKMFVTLAPGCPVLPPLLGCVRHFRRRKFCSRSRGQVGESRRSAQKELPGREEPPVGNKYIAGRHDTQHNGASYDTQHRHSA